MTHSPGNRRLSGAVLVSVALAGALWAGTAATDPEVARRAATTTTPEPVRGGPVTAVPEAPLTLTRLQQIPIDDHDARAWFEAHRPRFGGRSFEESRDTVLTLMRVERARAGAAAP